ncbi:hypothetical protein AB834_01120 [PVC group bacterium (ex Bugula neritina AB1)]|nr:hypothetical protein AB834_01120 [PVC group bacterium (ex Bugula neritina AB1)]
MIFFCSLLISLMTHALMLSLFYVSVPPRNFYLPKMTRVSFLPLEVHQLKKNFSSEGSVDSGNDRRDIFGSEKKTLDPFQVTTYPEKKQYVPNDFVELPDSHKNLKRKKNDVIVELNTQRKVVRIYYPKYPLWAKKAGLQPDVFLKFQILNNGKVGTILLQKFSGHPELDALGLRAVRRWRFEPLPEGVDVDDQWGSVTLKFRLNQ